MGKTKSDDVKQLVQELENSSKLQKKGKAYKIPCRLFHSNLSVNSWKFNEWDYGKPNIKLASNARGLFISDDDKNPEIIVRGYDKFFNIDEIPMTRWENLKEYTSGPYEVTVKENGCIIFISGLKDGTIVTCSKHSTGLRDDVNKNHALAGEKFLYKQLEKSNIKISELGKVLYEMNCTAVVEYCDDLFEEHILEYTKDKAGLYLHGINYNLANFKTLGIDDVSNFAKRFNFKMVKYIVKDDILTLKFFLEECSSKGSYNNMEIEGFVIRCKNIYGNDFFFKYKFEEPYLMYRQWREVTKEYILTKVRTFRFKKHKFITNKYLDFVIPILDNNAELCAEYINGFQIINLRNMFLESYGMSGFEILNHEKLMELELENSLDYDTIDEHTKFLFIPIATIGCGKTTIALTLKNLYPDTWGHIQNDDINGRDKSMLMKQSLDLLSKDKIKAVIVDKNNHQFRERKQLFDWIESLKEDYFPYDINIKVIALSFSIYADIEVLKKLTISRVMTRGDNHQTIKATTDNNKKISSIMNGFLKRYQPLDDNMSPDNMFDFVINLDVCQTNSSLENVKHILSALHQQYPILVPIIPDTKDIDECFKKALTYRPVIKKDITNNDKPGKKLNKYKPTFFSADILDHTKLITEIKNIVIKENVPSTNAIYRLLNENLFQNNFHMTLSHVTGGKKGTKLEKDLWCEFNKRYNRELLRTESVLDSPKSVIKTKDQVTLTMDELIWDNNIVTIVVRSHILVDHENKPISKLWSSNKYPHITIGILTDGIKPFYSNDLCLISDQNYKNKQRYLSESFNILTFDKPIEMVGMVTIHI